MALYREGPETDRVLDPHPGIQAFPLPNKYQAPLKSEISEPASSRLATYHPKSQDTCEADNANSRTPRYSKFAQTLPKLAGYMTEMRPEPPPNNRQASKPSGGDLATSLTKRSESPVTPESVKNGNIYAGKHLEDALDNGEEILWDSDLPMSREKQFTERQSIKAAMKSIDDVDDAPQHNGQDAQAVKMVKNGHFPEHAYNTIAHDILCYAHRSQISPLLQAYLKPDRNDFETVDQRLASIKHSLMKSKAMVKALMDPWFLYRLCDAPRKELDKKISNKKLNAKRNVQVRAGKNLLAAQPSGDDGKQTTADMPGAQRLLQRQENPTVAAELNIPHSPNPPPQYGFGSGRPTIHQQTVAGLETRAAREMQLPGDFVELRTVLSNRYRVNLARLLRIPWRLADNLTLDQLRLYARAYHGPLKNVPWFWDHMPRDYVYALGPFFCEAGFNFCHFAQLVRGPWLAIANERHDINANGEVDVTDSSYFVPHTAEENQALGAVPNLFGGYHGLYSGVDPRLPATL